MGDFHLLDEQFAVSASHVREMVAMPKVVTVWGITRYAYKIKQLAETEKEKHINKELWK